MKCLDIARGEFQRLKLCGFEFPPGIRGELRDGNQAGRCSIDPLRLLAKLLPAAAADVIDDRPHVRLESRRSPLLRPRQRCPPACPVQFLPDQPLHIIIFSMGTTRIAEAPASFSFCSVSQKTDSWQTA